MSTYSDVPRDARGVLFDQGRAARPRTVDRILADVNNIAGQYKQQARGALTKEQAMAAALDANPDLYAEYKRAHAARVFRYQAGEE